MMYAFFKVYALCMGMGCWCGHFLTWQTSICIHLSFYFYIARRYRVFKPF